jgi:hypothetical protein
MLKIFIIFVVASVALIAGLVLIIMAPLSGPSHNSVALVLPLTFINKGHGSSSVWEMHQPIPSKFGLAE